ncbi:MAG: hypothetical protein ACHP9Y_03865, partial [Gammaproteobacteria bacterium]
MKDTIKIIAEILIEFEKNTMDLKHLFSLLESLAGGLVKNYPDQADSRDKLIDTFCKDCQDQFHLIGNSTRTLEAAIALQDAFFNFSEELQLYDMGDLALIVNNLQVAAYAVRAAIEANLPSDETPALDYN